jgi:hypothetical protein
MCVHTTPTCEIVTQENVKHENSALACGVVRGRISKQITKGSKTALMDVIGLYMYH